MIWAGASVDMRYTFDAVISAVGMIFIALVFRAAGVWTCLFGTNLGIEERFFCVIVYLHKATVQTAIGSIPLSLCLP